MKTLVKALVITSSVLVGVNLNAANMTQATKGDHPTSAGQSESDGSMASLNAASQYPDTVVLRKVYVLAFQNGLLEKELYVNNPTLPALQSAYDYLLEKGMASKSIERIYPNEAIMVDIYLRMAQDKHIRPGEGIMAANVSTEILQAVFDMALALGVVDDHGSYRDAALTDVARKDPTGLGLPVMSKAATAACKVSVTACAIGASVAVGPVIVSCAAALYQSGVNYASDAKCVEAVAAARTASPAVAASCAAMAVNCTHRDNPATFAWDTVGVESGTKESRFCSATGRAHNVSIQRNTNSGTVAGLKLGCTVGGSLTFGSVTTPHVQVCNNDTLVGGLTINFLASGNGIASVGTRCDRVGRNDNESNDNQIFAQVGGSGGTQRIRSCPEHQYLIGLDTWRANGIIRGIKVYCK